MFGGLFFLGFMAFAFPIYGQTLSVATFGRLPNKQDGWEKHIETVRKEHVDKAKKAGKAIFPKCEELSIPVNIKIEQWDIIISSDVNCKLGFLTPR